nr:PREDICTED: uncharacterized protein LOC105662036 isoform X1 [Megachile rotundata]XP_012137126.1 PREDICTED: uncharacterized protein LOC105662036 isoform X1 [Megachile rotundata]XP_012137128.1 PREDICTED: uncharacterized protein LOC105662036 isoform X1 [Megachile rotundata]
MQSYPLRNLMFFSEEVRQIVAGVSQVPVAISSVLGAIGKIEGSTIWHAFLPDADVEDPIHAALHIMPSNIRDILERVNAGDTPLAYRQQIRQMCAIPGVHWSGESRILNVDSVWPVDYSTDHLREDVHCFMNLLTRVSGRLPKSFLASLPPGGSAAKSGLVSMDPVGMCVTSRFLTVMEARTTLKRAAGQQDRIAFPAADAAAARYWPQLINKSAAKAGSTTWVRWPF